MGKADEISDEDDFHFRMDIGTGCLFIGMISIFRSVMTWRRAYEYYSQRREEAYSRLRGDPMFQRFKEFLDWRKSQTV